MTSNQDEQEILTVENLALGFASRRGTSNVLRNVTLSLSRGEILGIVGESGSGKSLTCRSVIRLLPPHSHVTNGRITFEGTNVLAMSTRELRQLRARHIGMVFQDPFTSLNPTLRIERQLLEVLRVNGDLRQDEARRRAVDLLGDVELRDPERVLSSYPFELSGGMRQRVMIAIALANGPSVLIADEPTTALDVSTQAQVLSLIQRLRLDLGMAILLVSHDFGVIASMCDRVAVMYGGYVVESGRVEDVCLRPLHPYSRALIQAVPDLSIPIAGSRRPTIPGPPLAAASQPEGCPFQPRCSFASAECTTTSMVLVEQSAGHFSACPFVNESSIVDVGEEMSGVHIA